MLRAMLLGTPTWSSSRFGSPVMTVRAEKSTRLPIRLPRRRPSLPFRRARSDLTGRPDDWSDCGKPAISLSIYVATWYCSRSAKSFRICAGAPSCSIRCKLALALMISASLYVKSSCPMPLPNSVTPGRTCGGGTGNTVMIIQSGCAKSSDRPSIVTSSGDTFFRMVCASEASKGRFSDWVMRPAPSSSSSLLCFHTVKSFSASLRIAGCTRPQPPWPIFGCASPSSSSSLPSSASQMDIFEQYSQTRWKRRLLFERDV